MKLLLIPYAVLVLSSPVTAGYASWQGFRGAQINNSVALEGGILQTGNFTGGKFTNTSIVSPGSGYGGGPYRILDLTKSFSAGADAEQMLIAKPETVDPNAPAYVSGAMFHNDRSWWTFGGLPRGIKVSTQPNSVVRGTLSGAGSGGVSTTDGMPQKDGENNVFQNVTAGAYASSADPGLKLGWFLGGIYNPNSTTWRYPMQNTSTLIPDDIFYQADMTNDYQIKLTSIQTPSGQVNGYLPRAQGGLVWLPYGSKGVLVALGGVQYPADFYSSGAPVTSTDNNFMSELLIYDVANAKWYSQSTLEGTKPPQLASFCTAVVPTQDGFSQEIIVYGGYDGTGSLNNPPSDDVWILSVPAFQWTQVIQSRNAASHGRKSSFCFSPNPSTFITVGGTTLSGSPLTSDTFMDVLNLNNMSWTGTYDASSEQKFSVPSAVVTQLKWPDAKGPGSRVIGNINNQALSSLFSSPYPTAIKTNYPYAAASSTSTTTPSSSASSTSTPKPGPNIALIASLATVIPIVVIALLVGACILYRRRKRGDQHNRNKRSEVSSWAGKVDRDEKSNVGTETTFVDDYGASPVIPAVQRKDNDIYEADHQNILTPPPHSPRYPSYNKDSQPAYEIMDHEPRGAAALSAHPTSVNGQHSEIRSELGSDKHASELPQSSSRDNLSVPSGGVVAGASQSSPISRKPVAERRESTPLPSPSTPNMGHTRGTSDVSSAGLTASPNTEYRRSQHIDNLPDTPGLLGEGHLTPTTQGRPSAYKEKFDDK